jgi:hypothetical protein
MTDSKKIEELEKELQEIKEAAKAVYQLVHYMEDNDGRIYRLKTAIFSKKK